MPVLSCWLYYTGFTALRENLENRGKDRKIEKIRENLGKPGKFD